MKRRLKSRFLVGGLGLLAIGLGLAFSFWPRTRLNVILITLDTTRADHIGCYGYSQARTPAIDSLADQGVVFERAYAPAPVTLPSHASMFTGLYPPEHGLRSNGRGRLGNGIPVLAELLRNANYETGAFVGSFVLNSKFGLERGFQTYDDDFSDATADELEHQRRDGGAVVNAALAWLRAKKSKPFFCWVHLYDPHAYYDARSKIFGDEFIDHPYDAGIAFTDLQVQRLRDFLQTNQLDVRTLVIVVGDHGEDLMEHQERQHGNQLYDTTLRVPLIFSGSPRAKLGARVTAPVSLVDLAPTIADCLQLPPPGPTTGRSIKAALAGGQLEPRSCYAETEVPFLENRWAPLRGLVNDRWKYIETTHSELYDLIDDPQELHNLAETLPETFRDLQNEFEELSGRMVPHEASSVNLTANEQHILESLGYVAGRGNPTRPDATEQLPDVKDMLPLFNELMVARNLLHNGSVDDAVVTLQNILEKAPRYYQARLVLGDALLAQKQFAEALINYQTVASERPDSGDAEGRWANLLAAQGLFEESIPHYRKVLKILPEVSRYRIKLAQALIHLGRLQEAVAEFEEALRHNPNDVNAHLELANLFMQGGRVKAAIPHYEAVVKIQPTHNFARLNLASALARDGRLVEAISQAGRVVESDSKSYEARYTLGAILLTQNRFREASVQLKEACQLRPDDAAPRSLLQQAQAAISQNTPP